MIASWLEVDCNNCDIKYTIMFDEKVLIDLDDEEKVVNLFAHNERIGHIYIAPIKNDNTSPIMNVDM